MIVNNIKKIFLSTILLYNIGAFCCNADENLVINNDNEKTESNKYISKYDYKIGLEQKKQGGFKKRSFTITPYFGLSFVKQTYNYLGSDLTTSMHNDFIKRQQITLGISFDSYYNINKTFAISAGLGISSSGLFSESSKGVDYYFDVYHYEWINDPDFGRVKNMLGYNHITIQPLVEIVVPFHLKIRLNNYFSIEPYAFLGINISKIKNEYHFEHDVDRMNYEIEQDEIIGDVMIVYPDKIEKKISVGLATGCGLNLLFFKERVVIGAEYKYLENKKYNLKFMVNTFTLKFAYRFNVF